MEMPAGAKEERAQGEGQGGHSALSGARGAVDGARGAHDVGRLENEGRS